MTNPRPMWAIFLLVRQAITPERVLESPSRARILELIAAHPGISTGRLRALAEMGWGTFLYHFAHLQRAGAVHVERTGRDRFVSLPSASQARPQVADRALASLAARRVAIATIARPGASVMEIARDAGISRRMTYYHVGALLQAGLLVSGSRTRHLDLRASPELIERLRELGVIETPL